VKFSFDQQGEAVGAQPQQSEKEGLIERYEATPAKKRKKTNQMSEGAPGGIINRGLEREEVESLSSSGMRNLRLIAKSESLLENCKGNKKTSSRTHYLQRNLPKWKWWT